MTETRWRVVRWNPSTLAQDAPNKQIVLREDFEDYAGASHYKAGYMTALTDLGWNGYDQHMLCNLEGAPWLFSVESYLTKVCPGCCERVQAADLAPGGDMCAACAANDEVTR